MEKLSLFFVGFFIFSNIIAQNPIVPPGMFIADPEAHVWDDGRLYMYGSRDESDDFWCSYTYHVLSTDDLINWDIDENSISSIGENDQIDYHDRLLFAPDCAYKNGIYYLYYCSPKKQTEGVATSFSPYGPFANGKEIIGPKQIDPSVLIDDNGQGYYWWGQQNAKVAKLNDDMITIDTANIMMPLDKEGAEAFHEGASIRKINDKYYLVFADDSRNNSPTCIGYAISDNPMGPFFYKGVIIDNVGCDPSVWNNHGSIQKFNDQWYVFYHRSTNNSQKFRKACIEPITINEDGTIDEVEMTSQGAGAPLCAIKRIEAEWACQLSGNVRISSVPFTDIPQEGLTKIKNNDRAGFKYISFEKNPNRIEIKTFKSLGGKIEVRLDNPDGKLIGTCTIESDSQNIPYQITTCEIDKTQGVRAVWLVFKGENEHLFDIDWFRFY